MDCPQECPLMQSGFSGAQSKSFLKIYCTGYILKPNELVGKMVCFATYSRNIQVSNGAVAFRR
jgi:hypothetical protein